MEERHKSMKCGIMSFFHCIGLLLFFHWVIQLDRSYLLIGIINWCIVVPLLVFHMLQVFPSISDLQILPGAQREEQHWLCHLTLLTAEREAERERERETENNKIQGRM